MSHKSERLKYMKKGFFLTPEFRFWDRPDTQHLYSEKTKERLNALAESFYNRKHIHEP